LTINSASDQDKKLGPCPLCGRDMTTGPSVNRHHWTPKLKNGETASWIHVVCHRMIHRTFSEADLARHYSTPEALLGHPDIKRFVSWVRKKPADYVDWPKKSSGEMKKRR